MPPIFRALGLLGIGLVLGQPGWANASGDLSELPFDQLVTQDVEPASRLAQQVSDSPSAVTIVTADDIRAYGYRTLADVINSMRGLYTTYDHRYHYMAGRGFGAPGDYAGRIMLLIDGYATQDNLFNQAYIEDSGLLDLEMVERVEYVPGTGSVTYGNNALLGIINVVTRKGRDLNSTQVAVEWLSHGGRKQRISTGRQLDNGADLLLSASWLNRQGQDLYFPAYDTPATNSGWALGQDGERSQRLFAKYSLEGLTLEGAYVDRTKHLPTNPNPYSAFNTPFVNEDENAFVNLSYDTDLGLTLRSASRLYWGHYSYRNLRQYADTSDGIQYGQRLFQGEWWGLDQKFVSQALARHTLVFGLEFRQELKQHFRVDYLSPQGGLVERLSEDFARHTNSVYATDEFQFHERWWLNWGARYDDASDQPGHWSPRLALIYRPDSSSTWKASYSEAFRLPNADERSGYGAAARSEQVAAGELAWQHHLTQQQRLTVSLYHYRRSHQMVYSDALDDYVDTGRSSTRGLETELEQTWDGGTRLRGSLAWQNAHDTDGLPLVNSPHLLGKLNVSLPLPGQAWRLGMEWQYQGARQTLERRRLSGYSLLHLTLSSQQKWHGWSAIFSVRNALNQSYDAVSPFDWRPDSGLPQDSLRMDGRTYWLQLAYDF